MGKALYRKYRPQNLAEVVGEEQVTDTLKKSLASGKISHAYLFVGPRGCGKTSVARIFAHEINDFKYELEDDYVDIIEIDGASNRGIDNIRELREKATIAPSKGKYKVYIIDEVHMLTKEAFNALLKTLEEPPSHVIFVMATTDFNKVPVTIVSRAQVYKFKLADTKTMQKHLRMICDKEKIAIDDDALAIIVKRGGGSFRDTLSLLDQISTLSDKKITKQDIINAIGVPDDEKIANLLISYASGDVVKITTELKDLFSSDAKPEIIVEEIIQQIVERPAPVYMPLLSQLADIRGGFIEAKLLVALLSNQTTPIAQTTQPAPISIPAAQPTPRPVVENEKLKSEKTKPIPTKQEAQTQAMAQIEDIQAPISAPITDGIFSWNDFLQNVQKLDDAVYIPLSKCNYSFANNALNIIPTTGMAHNVLSRDKNKAVLIQAGGGIRIEIGDVKKTNIGKDDPIASKISDIMGGAEEVKQDGGTIPF